MATIWNICKTSHFSSACNLYYSGAFLLKCFRQQNRIFCVIHDHVLVCGENHAEDDVLDQFTTRLVQNRAERWDKVRNRLFKNDRYRLCKNEVLESPSSDCLSNVHNLNIAQVDELFARTFEQNSHADMIRLVEVSVRHKIRPSHALLVKVIDLCSKRGDVDMIMRIKSLCDPKTIEKYSHFLHYIAEASWRGGNLNVAIELFLEAYRGNVSLRMPITTKLKYLITDIVTDHSEGALLTVIKFCECLLQEFDERLPLFYVWQTSFFSEWFSDQRIALDLAEKHASLFDIIICRIHLIVAIALSKHQSDVVVRLLEVLLKHELKREYTTVVLALLNYKIYQRDLCCCKEILHWCNQHGIELPHVWQEKYLKLLLGLEMVVPSERSVVHKSNVFMKF